MMMPNPAMTLIQQFDQILMETTVDNIVGVAMSQSNFVQLKRELNNRYLIPMYELIASWEMEVNTFIGKIKVYGSGYFKDSQFFVISKEFMEDSMLQWQTSGTFKLPEGNDNDTETHFLKS